MLNVTHAHRSQGRRTRADWCTPPLPLSGDGLGYGPLGRNSGEVLGIVGKIVVTPRPFAAAPLVHDDGSVRTRNLAEMELPAKDLRPPPWPTRGVPPDLC